MKLSTSLSIINSLGNEIFLFQRKSSYKLFQDSKTQRIKFTGNSGVPLKILLPKIKGKK